MTTIALLHHGVHGMACTSCGLSVTAPEYSYDFSEEGLVVDLWTCASCGHRFETETSPVAPQPEIRSSVAEAVPALLVA